MPDFDLIEQGNIVNQITLKLAEQKKIDSEILSLRKKINKMIEKTL